MSLPISLNNPMSLMEYPTITWDGEKKPTSDPNGRLCQFDTMKNGIRAGCKNLLSYFLNDGCSTIRECITRYAPPNENNTESYVDFVSMKCGIGQDDQVFPNNQDFMETLCGAIIAFENGADAAGISDDEIAAGVAAAFA